MENSLNMHKINNNPSGPRARYQVYVHERPRDPVLHGLCRRRHQGVGPEQPQDRAHLPGGARQTRPLQEHQPGSRSGDDIKIRIFSVQICSPGQSQ